MNDITPKEYSLLRFHDRPSNTPGKWVDVVYRGDGPGEINRDTVQILGTPLRVNGSLVYDALDGDPETPEDRSNVMINIAQDSLRKAIINRAVAIKLGTAIAIIEIGTITYY